MSKHTYRGQYECYSAHWKWVIHVVVYHPIVARVLVEYFVDDDLDDIALEEPRSSMRILYGCGYMSKVHAWTGICTWYLKVFFSRSSRASSTLR